MKLSVIFPCKDQTAKLLTNLREKGLPFFDSLGITYEFLIVSDGSNESQQKAMEEGVKSFPMQVKLLPYENHLGKGHNVQHGILEGDGDYFLFMDSDFATDLNVLKEMLKDLGKVDCMIASRHAKGSVIATPQGALRKLMGKVSRSLIRHRFKLPLTDTQCGFKMFRKEPAKEIAKRQIIDGFAFDVEYLYFFALNGYSIKEYPCRWEDDSDSTISHPLKTSLRFSKDLKRIKKNRKNYILQKKTPTQKGAE